MKRKKREKKLRSSIMWSLISMTVIAILISTMLYVRNCLAIKKSELSHMQETGIQLDDVVTIALSNLESLHKIHYVDLYARNILMSENSKNDMATKFQNQSYMDRALKHVVSADTVITRAAILTTTGDVYCTDSYLPEAYVRYVTDTAEELGMYEGVLTAEDYYVCDYYEATTKKRTILHPLYAYPKKPIAILAVDMDASALGKILEGSISGKNGDFLVLTDQKELFHFGTTEFSENDSEIIRSEAERLLETTETLSELMIHGKRYYLTVKRNTLLGWDIVQVVSEREMLEEANKAMASNILIVVLVLSATVLGMIQYTKRITEPLERFCEKVRNTGDGKVDTISLPEQNLAGEIQDVVENYNLMAGRVNDYISKEVVYVKNQKTTQSMMLRYQINPHFMYNTLNTIASMGELADCPEIVEITTNLSFIMHYNVKGDYLVSLKTELDMIRAYLKIQEIRFRGNFRVIFDIDESLLPMRIIKFVLQPVVENVFSHGFQSAGRNRENLIRIQIYSEDRALIIRVRDNGDGIPKEELDRLNHRMQHETDSTSVMDEEDKWRGSIGINNVNTRIKNYYGNSYGITLSSDYGSFTEVILRLGIELNSEEKSEYEEDTGC